MELRHTLREHEPAVLPSSTAESVIAAVRALAPVLKPRLRQVARVDGGAEVRNFIGSVRLDDGSVLEVEPKVRTALNWPEAVAQLLGESTRISVTGSQRSRIGERRPDLTAVIAFEYARRLERALSKDGPIQVFERESHTSRRIIGQLDVGRYARNAWRDSALFPLRRDELTVVNEFARGLSIVSRLFRRSVTDAALDARLRRLESMVLPGQALPSHVNPAVAARRLPPQWKTYRPAWDIAAAVIRNRSVINDPGHSLGLEVAVEPWPLLETLLMRSLEAVARDERWDLVTADRRSYPVLRFDGAVAGQVIPDGELRRRDGQVVATFEAKYTSPGIDPADSHRYQALSTAAVLNSPLSVIVYPGKQEPKIYDVQGFKGRPAKLATIGLDMYEYDRGSGAKARAGRIMDLLTRAGILRVAAALADIR